MNNAKNWINKEKSIEPNIMYLVALGSKWWNVIYKRVWIEIGGGAIIQVDTLKLSPKLVPFEYGNKL